MRCGEGEARLANVRVRRCGAKGNASEGPKCDLSSNVILLHSVYICPID